jgi:hypothetical protein
MSRPLEYQIVLVDDGYLRAGILVKHFTKKAFKLNLLTWFNKIIVISKYTK